jgi:EmrB/QacA subfamily drug resistance transporter
MSLEPPPDHRGTRAAVLAVTLGALMPGLATTILAVADGDLATDLHVGLGDLQWITTAYLLGLTASLVLAGKLGDRHGRRRIFLLGIAGFGLTSLLVGISTPVPLLIGLRVAQGVFGGFLTTNALSLLRASVPEPRLPAAIGIFNSVQGLSIAAGPVLGGAVVEAGGWRWTMYLNVPLALACLLLGRRALREVRLQRSAGFDLAGTLLLVLSLSALVYALIDAPSHGWGAPSTIVLLAVAALTLIAFVLVEARSRDPLLPLSLFRDRSFGAGSLLSVLAFFALNGGLFVVSLFWLQIQHVPSAGVGVRLLPLGAGMLIGAVLSGRLIATAGDRWSLFTGSVLVAAGLVATSTATVGGGYLPLGAGLALIGLGLGPLVTSTVNATVGQAPVELAGAAAGAQQTAGRLGATLGVAVLGGVMAAATGERFSRLLEHSALPADVLASLGRAGSTAVAGGVAPVPAGAAPDVVELVTRATQVAFVSGMRTTVLTAAVIAAAGALLALLVRDGRTRRPQHPQHTDSSGDRGGHLPTPVPGA